MTVRVGAAESDVRRRWEVADGIWLRTNPENVHRRQVAHMVTLIVGELDLPDDQVRGIEVASTLHDIGKVAIPEELLDRRDHLSPGEVQVMKGHCQAGYDIVAEFGLPWPVAEMILQHHERIDGSGYPRGLKGDEILIGARVLAVADVISAMAGEGVHPPGLTLADALNEIEANQGSLYDPAVVDVCLPLFRGGRFRDLVSL